MAGRRAFLGGLLASGLCPVPSWADARNPSYLAAARRPSGRFELIGLDGSGQEVFAIPLPDRGHAAAAHPQRPEAVAFARRPGTFALVIDCRSGGPLAQLISPSGRHFYGHGTFLAGGDILATTENDFETARGVIGLWDARNGYRRMGEVPSGGVGPHEIKTLRDDATLVVANGGIETHPDSGRVKLNLGTMEPNLTTLDLASGLRAQVAPPPELRRASLRHLAVGADDQMAVAIQWQGDPSDTVPLLATWAGRGPLVFHQAPGDLSRQAQGYGGSVAISAKTGQVSLTAPRGGLAFVHGPNGDFQRHLSEEDVCGVASRSGGFMWTTGLGRIIGSEGPLRQHPVHWDNHLVAIA